MIGQWVADRWPWACELSLRELLGERGSRSRLARASALALASLMLPSVLLVA